jgi:aminopeptidase N
LENPNKVRSLIGAFAANNMLHFHHISGKGYEFLADQVIALNKLNPQVASRMASVFNSWKKLNKIRQMLIEKQLLRIKNTENLSPDVFEIVDKALS